MAQFNFGDAFNRATELELERRFRNKQIQIEVEKNAVANAISFARLMQNQQNLAFRKEESAKDRAFQEKRLKADITESQEDRLLREEISNTNQELKRIGLGLERERINVQRANKGKVSRELGLIEEGLRKLPLIKNDKIDNVGNTVSIQDQKDQIRADIFGNLATAFDKNDLSIDDPLLREVKSTADKNIKPEDSMKDKRQLYKESLDEVIDVSKLTSRQKDLINKWIEANIN